MHKDQEQASSESSQQSQKSGNRKNTGEGITNEFSEKHKFFIGSGISLVAGRDLKEKETAMHARNAETVRAVQPEQG